MTTQEAQNLINNWKGAKDDPKYLEAKEFLEEQQKEAGLDPALIRVSVGLESIEDIIADFEQALEQI